MEAVLDRELSESANLAVDEPVVLDDQWGVPIGAEVSEKELVLSGWERLFTHDLCSVVFGKSIRRLIWDALDEKVILRYTVD